MSLITIVKSAQARLDLPITATVISATDATTKQLRELMEDVGRTIVAAGNWQVLQTEKTFTATATTEQSGVIPTDFDHFINRTMFNRTKSREVRGPVTPQYWQYNQSVISTTVYDIWRRRGNSVLLAPTPTAGDTYAFEYISKNFCESAGGTEQASWMADTDVARIDEELFTLGLVWKYKAAKGFDFTVDLAVFEGRVKELLAEDGGKPDLQMGGMPDPGPRYPGVQEGSWPI